MSTQVAQLQDAVIKQHCKSLRMPTVASQFSTLAEQAVREKKTHAGYLEVLLTAEVEERERGTGTDVVEGEVRGVGGDDGEVRAGAVEGGEGGEEEFGDDGPVLAGGGVGEAVEGEKVEGYLWTAVGGQRFGVGLDEAGAKQGAFDTDAGDADVLGMGHAGHPKEGSRRLIRGIRSEDCAHPGREGIY